MRFEVKKCDNEYCVFDNDDGKNVVAVCDVERISQKTCELLNEQNETIQDQKRQLDELDGLLNKFEVTFEELEDVLYMNRSRL